MTTTRYARLLALSTAATLTAFATCTAPASAQTLFDMLFRDRPRHAPQQPPAVMVPAEQPKKVVTPPKVAGPQYYTYKTDPLVRVDFSAIVPQRQRDGASLSAPGIDHTTVGTIEDRIEEVLEDAKATEVSSQPEGAASPAASPEPASDAASTPPSIETQTEITIQAEAPAAQPLTEEQIRSLQDFALLAEKNVAEALVANYSQEPSFIWVADGAITQKAQAVLKTLSQADQEGLDPHDYAVTVPGSDAGEGALTAFEMELSARVLRYARDAHNGRIDPNRISGYHDFKPKEFDGVNLLRDMRASTDVVAFLDGLHPQNAYYKALRAELARLRESAENDIIVDPKTVVKPGETNPEFAKILTLISRRADETFRLEHGDVLTRHLGSDTYAQELVPVIKAAQRMVGIGDDGVIGPRTVLAIAGESKASSIEKVRIAMEQIRWLPSDFTDRYVFINTPAFEAYYVEDGKQKLSMRTVVGRLETQTFFFQNEISYVEFHPYWGMPRSILVNTYLPRVLKDPSYFDRNGYEVVDRNGRVVSSTAIDWSAYGANIPFDVRQRPGANNALGEMKIMFPNPHAIYMHDTPEKHLFARENRALSNGCIRLSDPRAMAAAVLGWDKERVAKRLQAPHGRETLKVKVPVYVSYFTAWPDESGEVRYFNDVYSRDEKVRAALDKVGALRAAGV